MSSTKVSGFFKALSNSPLTWIIAAVFCFVPYGYECFQKGRLVGSPAGVIGLVALWMFARVVRRRSYKIDKKSLPSDTANTQ